MTRMAKTRKIRLIEHGEPQLRYLLMASNRLMGFPPNYRLDALESDPETLALVQSVIKSEGPAKRAAREWQRGRRK